MSNDLKFELPPRPMPRARGHWALTAAAVVIAWAIGFFLRPGRIGPNGRTPPPSTDAPALLSAAELASLAEMLERNQLYAEAAKAWQRAAELSPPADAAKAERLFRIGKNLSLAGQHEPALAYLLAAETADREGRWRESINTLVLEGLSALGLEEARAYQAQRRVSLTARNDDTAAKPVAEIGGEPITEADLRQFARRMIAGRMASQRGLMSEEAFDKAVESQLEPFRTPEGRRELLQTYITQELLYREALAANVREQKAVQEQIVDGQRQILVGAFLNDYLGRNLRISDTDVENAYAARKADYVEPEAVKAEAIVVDGEEAKKKASEALDGGAAFAEVRAKYSTVRPSADSPDVFDRWITRDDRVPLVSDSKAAAAHLFALDKGAVGGKWFEAGGGRWVRFRLADRRAERPLPLAECRDRVERDLRARKREDLLKQLQQELQGKYKVVLKEESTGKE